MDCKLCSLLDCDCVYVNIRLEKGAFGTFLVHAEKVTGTSLERSLKRKLLSCGKEYASQRRSGSD